MAPFAAQSRFIQISQHVKRFQWVFDGNGTRKDCGEWNENITVLTLFSLPRADAMIKNYLLSYELCGEASLFVMYIWHV